MDIPPHPPTLFLPLSIPCRAINESIFRSACPSESRVHRHSLRQGRRVKRNNSKSQSAASCRHIICPCRIGYHAIPHPVQEKAPTSLLFHLPGRSSAYPRMKPRTQLPWYTPSDDPTEMSAPPLEEARVRGSVGDPNDEHRGHGGLEGIQGQDDGHGDKEAEDEEARKRKRSGDDDEENDTIEGAALGDTSGEQSPQSRRKSPPGGQPRQRRRTMSGGGSPVAPRSPRPSHSPLPIRARALELRPRVTSMGQRSQGMVGAFQPPRRGPRRGQFSGGEGQGRQGQAVSRGQASQEAVGFFQPPRAGQLSAGEGYGQPLWATNQGQGSQESVGSSSEVHGRMPPPQRRPTQAENPVFGRRPPGHLPQAAVRNSFGPFYVDAMLMGRRLMDFLPPRVFIPGHPTIPHCPHVIIYFCDEAQPGSIAITFQTPIRHWGTAFRYGDDAPSQMHQDTEPNHQDAASDDEFSDPFPVKGSYLFPPGPEFQHRRFQPGGFEPIDRPSRSFVPIPSKDSNCYTPTTHPSACYQSIDDFQATFGAIRQGWGEMDFGSGPRPRPAPQPSPLNPNRLQQTVHKIVGLHPGSIHPTTEKLPTIRPVVKPASFQTPGSHTPGIPSAHLSTIPPHLASGQPPPATRPSLRYTSNIHSKSTSDRVPARAGAAETGSLGRRRWVLNVAARWSHEPRYGMVTIYSVQPDGRRSVAAGD
jgi:hypothetical protein